MAVNETEEIDVAKEFNLLPVVFETIQALQKTSDPQELTKKVFFSINCSFDRRLCETLEYPALNSQSLSLGLDCWKII